MIKICCILLLLLQHSITCFVWLKIEIFIFLSFLTECTVFSSNTHWDVVNLENYNLKQFLELFEINNHMNVLFYFIFLSFNQISILRELLHLINIAWWFFYLCFYDNIFDETTYFISVQREMLRREYKFENCMYIVFNV